MTSSAITIKRELWHGKHKKGYHSVARENGRFVKAEKWHGKQSTEKVTQYIEKKYQPSVRPPAPRRPVAKRFDITLEITTTFHRNWYIVISSHKKHLSPNDLRNLKSKILKQYQPIVEHPIYDEGISGLPKPILCRDSATGEKEVF